MDEDPKIAIYIDYSEKKDTLANQVVDYLIENESYNPRTEKSFTPSPVHRLDRNTSGIVICGVSLAGLQAMSELLRSRDLHKYYRTFGLGTMTKPVEETPAEVVTEAVTETNGTTEATEKPVSGTDQPAPEN